jgi:hypothetical protein
MIRTSINSRILTIIVRSLMPQSERALVTSARNVSFLSHRPSPWEYEKEPRQERGVGRAGALISLSPDVWAGLSVGDTAISDGVSGESAGLAEIPADG